MLLLLDLWRDLEPRRVGVIRNPVSVALSLTARGGPAAGLGPDGCVALWKLYARPLLDELRRSPFPVVDFDRTESVPEQVRGALAARASGGSRLRSLRARLGPPLGGPLARPRRRPRSACPLGRAGGLQPTEEQEPAAMIVRGPWLEHTDDEAVLVATLESERGSLEPATLRLGVARE